MKKAFSLILALLVVFNVALTCFAAEDVLTVTDVKAEPGDVVYLTLMLNEKTVGNSMGVSTACDSSILEFVPDSSSWESSATLQDFNKQGDGVWAVKTPKDLQGAVCVLAFRVKENAAFTSTTVECTLMVKNDGKDVGTYTAEAQITHDCDHNYGPWKDAGQLGHVRTCGNCDAGQTESHSWDEGVISPKPGDSKTNLKTYTCQICGAAKVIEFAVSGENEVSEPTRPTQPVETQPAPILPTAPVEIPTPATRPPQEDTDHGFRPAVPTEPIIPVTGPQDNTGGSSDHVQTPNSPNTSKPGTSQNQNGNSSQGDHNHSVETTPYQDYNQPPADVEDHSGHQHAMPTEPPIAVPLAPGKNEQSATEHVHTEGEPAHVHEYESQNISVGTVCAVLGTLAVIVAAAAYFLKKKR